MLGPLVQATRSPSRSLRVYVKDDDEPDPDDFPPVDACVAIALVELLDRRCCLLSREEQLRESYALSRQNEGKNDGKELLIEDRRTGRQKHRTARER